MHYGDRVKETTQTTGTGTYTLAGAPVGFQSFVSGVGEGNDCFYTCTNGTDWEVGQGTAGTSTLTRTIILASSNAGNAVNWSAGSKDIFNTIPASEVSSFAGQFLQTDLNLNGHCIKGFDGADTKFLDIYGNPILLLLSNFHATDYLTITPGDDDFPPSIWTHNGSPIYLPKVKFGNGPVDLNTFKIINLADPVDAQDAVTKNYITTQGFLTEVPAQSWDSLTGKPTLFSGSYLDLTNIPITFPPDAHDHNDTYYQKSEVDTLLTGITLTELVDVDTTSPVEDQVLKFNGAVWVNSDAPSGVSSWNDLTDKPTLFDGQYSSLSGSPTALSQFTNDSGFITSIPAQAWSTITGKPSFGDIITHNVAEFATSTQGGKADTAVQPAGLTWSAVASKPTFASVATTGAYSDLSGKPTIPTALSSLTNDTNFITSASVHNVPSGGTTNQVLKKNSNSDYDTSWTTPASGGGGVDVFAATFYGGL